MTVEQLIEKLQKVEDKTKKVTICTYEEYLSTFDVVEDDDEVILE